MKAVGIPGIVAPTVARAYPTRVSLRFQGKSGQVALDQLRAGGQGTSGAEAWHNLGEYRRYDFR